MTGAWRTIVDTLTSPQFVVGVVWCGLLFLSVGLIVLMQTRWGQTKPLHKCVVLSLLAHMLLVAYATTIHIVSRPPNIRDEPSIRIATVDELPDPSAPSDPPRDPASPWEQFATSVTAGPAVEAPRQVELATAVDAAPAVDDSPESADDAVVGATDVEPTLTDPVADELGGASAIANAAPRPAEPLDAPAPETREVAVPDGPQSSAPEPAQVADAAAAEDATALAPPSPDSGPASLTTLPDLAQIPEPNAMLATEFPQPPREQSASLPAEAAPPVEMSAAEVANNSDIAAASPSIEGPRVAPLAPVAPRGAQGAASAPPVASDGRHAVPELYKLRLEPLRSRVVEGRGGSAETEAAVKAALAWLARNQAADGRWSAAQFGAGRETRTFGHDRAGAGADADAGITGLALLAFLGAGHTHQQGEHQRTVDRALQYLTDIQAADGNLAGGARTYAFMYCHGIATLALSEAFAMSGDPRLEQSVRRAIGYTLAAQNPTTGGWRYRPRETGDTSQLGWQLMALKSAELGGLPIPPATRDGMRRFLSAVSSGTHGGLAGYRPRERATATMTAEALVCRQFLGLDSRQGSGLEAGEYLLNDLPAADRANYYYWYYATLGMYQLQGEHWARWNESLVETLTSLQQPTGAEAGSWAPDPVWGGYGGRVYSTSLGALCLEVYYRYLPLHSEAAGRERLLR